MDIDFFKDYERVATVKIGKDLGCKFSTLEALRNMTLIDLKFPTDHPDAGSSIEVYSLQEERYLLARSLGILHSEECIKTINTPPESAIEKPSPHGNPETLAKIISLILDSGVNSFAFG